MDKPKNALITLILGVAFMAFLLIPINIFPEKLPYVTVPILYSWVAAAVAWQFQVSKEEESASDIYWFISNWSVAKYSAIYLLITALLILAVFYSYSLLGYNYA